MKRKIFLLIITLIALCYAGTVLDDSFRRDGHNRTFRIFIPQDTSPGASLILNLHGYGMSGLIMYASNSDFHYWADTGHCYVVYPDALLNNKYARSWNSGSEELIYDGNIQKWPSANVDDVGFLSALIDTLCKHYPIDTNRVFCTGVSDGGLMSFLLAAEIGDKIGKIATGISSLLYSTADLLEVAPPIPVMMFNGTADDTLPYYGMDTIYSVPRTIEILRSHNQCTAPPDSIFMPNIDKNDGFTTTFFSHKSDINNDVFLFRLNGMHHAWPGWTLSFPTPPHGDINATEHIWNFFIQDTFRIKSRIWARSTDIGPSLYMRPEFDSLHIVSAFYNKEAHAFNARAIVKNAQGTVVDSFELYDDGIHSDGAAGDDNCGGYIGPLETEDIYSVDMRSNDLFTGDKFIIKDRAVFTTAGPVIFDSLNVVYGNPFPGENIKYYVTMKNAGSAKTLKNLILAVSSADTNIQLTGDRTKGLPEIGPGQSGTNSQGYYMTIHETCPENYDALIDLSISYNGLVFWEDSCAIHIDSIPVQIIPIPDESSLDQNYPNPFNPMTTIRYHLPQDTDVEIRIYDITGKIIKTLFNDAQSAGSHTVNWNAADQSSGVYIYRLKTGEDIETKKMVLMK